MEYQSKLDLFLDTSPGGTTKARKMINTSLLKKKTQLKKGTITQIKLNREDFFLSCMDKEILSECVLCDFL